MRKQNRNNAMLSKLFFRLLPVQILLVAMGSFNAIVDGAMAGRFISADMIGVIGLFGSLEKILSAVGAVLLGGTAVLCGKHMGRGEMQKTKGIFSLNLTTVMLAGAPITGICLLFPGWLADALGANASLRAPLISYITGYAIGILPQLLAQQLASFLQMERKNTISYIGIAAMVLTNIVLDVVFVAVLKLEIRGLALATALSNWVYFLILVPHYFTKKAQFRYSIKAICWRELLEMTKIGLPGATLIFYLSVRTLLINRILLQYAGQEGLSAASAFNMISGLFIALCLGIGAVVRMLTSVFVGEEDRDSIRTILHIVFTKGLALSALVGAIVIGVSSPMTHVFFADPSSSVFILTRQLFVIYGFCVPLVMLCSVFSNYLQATGHNIYVNVQSVVDGLLGMVLPAMLLAPHMEALGVWLANPIGIVLTLLLVPAYGWFRLKRLPRTLDDWLFLKPDFGAAEKNRLEISISSMEDVVQTAVQVQHFCLSHGTASKTAYYSALCLEEMAGNIVKHGFAADRRSHRINCRVVYAHNAILLRIKDDCIPFNPHEWMEMVAPKDTFRNIGIRMVYRLAKDVSYQNLLGLNVLTVVLADKEKGG